VWKPLDKYFPRNYFTRKEFYALPVQAFLDGFYRFLYMSAGCVGSTHDSLAWSCSSLGHRLLSGLSLGEFWIAGDAAYVCSNNLLTPYSKAQIHDAELGPRRDSFNFYQSSLRMHVEKAVMIRGFRGPRIRGHHRRSLRSRRPPRRFGYDRNLINCCQCYAAQD
jgi:DDE superfamily endonuclease